MNKLVNIHNVNNDSNILAYSFTSTGVDIIRANIKGVQPECETVYTISSSNPFDYCRYLQNDRYKVSARLTNQRLLECVNFCKEVEIKEKVKAEQAAEAPIRPTVETIAQDIRANASEDEQYELAKLIASNIGYVLVYETVFDPTTNDPSIPLGKTFKVNKPIPECLKDGPSKIDSGGACEYYRIHVTHPMSQDQVPYTAECGDIMESLEMTYAEANIFKEIWRTAAERTLGVKKAGNSNKRAGEKVLFFAKRYYEQMVNGANLTKLRRVFKK